MPCSPLSTGKDDTTLSDSMTDKLKRNRTAMSFSTVKNAPEL